MSSREDRVRRLYRLSDRSSNGNTNDHEPSSRAPLVCLAPMVRAGTTPLRTLALEYGADLVYTEELMDRSILNTKRVVTTYSDSSDTTIDYVKDVSNANRKTIRKMGEHAPLLLRIDPKIETGKLIVQIGTGCSELAKQVATHVSQDADGIDVNMGCPKKFSTSGGMGSALLSDPARACTIIRSISNAVPNTPVSAKIRLLPTTQATVDFVSGLIHAGCNAIAIHGRRVGDTEVQPAKKDELKQVLEIVTAKHSSIPFFVNGDFYTRQDFTDYCSSTGARGVLLGRPALYNASIFRKPTDVNIIADAKYSYDSGLLLDKTTVIQQYLQHSLKYYTHYKNTKYVISEMMSFRRTPPHLVPFLPHVYPAGQTIGKTCDCQSLEQLCRVWNVNYQAHVRLDGKAVDATIKEFGDGRSYSDAYILDRLEKEQQRDGSPNEQSAKRAKVVTVESST
ncbi:hypothetical protein MPSEU_000661100 [Mayamaea pseudoterrestris]|nr:hypothetical protein MPSEU_000661100 [Mayamaea pseudoterrestris]